MNKWLLLVVMLILLLVGACSRAPQNKQHEVQNAQNLQLSNKKSNHTPTITDQKLLIQAGEPPKGIVPVKLFIPATRIDAIVEPVGVTDRGQMDVPLRTERVGYLASGVLPGATGNAVMDGHVDNRRGPAVFFPLKQLKKGDAIFIKNDRDDRIEFVVESVESFKTSQAPIARIFGPTKEAHLNLITCTGRYNREKREYEERLVVFTKRKFSHFT